MFRFSRFKLILCLSFALLCIVPLQVFASPNLTMSKEIAYDMGGNEYRCYIRIVNSGTSATSASDKVEVFEGVTLLKTTTMGGSSSLSANDSVDLYYTFTLTTSSTILNIKLTSPSSASTPQTIAFSLPAEAVGNPSEGGCSAGTAGIAGLFALAGTVFCRKHRK